MRQALQPHPSTPCSAVSAIEVYASRGEGGNLLLHYYAKGDPKAVVPSPWQRPTGRRADELWRHTCFEAFLKPEGEEAYVEFNFAPTHDWQIYGLTGYRAGLAPIEAIAKPHTESILKNDGWELRVHIPGIGAGAPGPWRLAVSAVIEDTSGAVSYWALRHAPGKPDFHHDDSFALSLPVTP